MANKKEKSPPPPILTYNKPGGEGTVIIRSGCAYCGRVSDHTPTCPKGNQQRVAGG